MTRIRLIAGDIAIQDVDVIVNAANSSLLGGCGVDGAIHRAAGPELLQACRRLRATDLPDGLAVGTAVATPGFGLAARHVVHTVGPVHGRGTRALLAAAYSSSLRLAADLGATSVALPAISAGAYGWPVTEVAETALDAAGAAPDGLSDIRFVLRPQAVLDAFESVRRDRG